MNFIKLARRNLKLKKKKKKKKIFLSDVQSTWSIVRPEYYVFSFQFCALTRSDVLVDKQIWKTSFTIAVQFSVEPVFRNSGGFITHFNPVKISLQSSYNHQSLYTPSTDRYSSTVR